MRALNLNLSENCEKGSWEVLAEELKEKSEKMTNIDEQIKLISKKQGEDNLQKTVEINQLYLENNKVMMQNKKGHEATKMLLNKKNINVSKNEYIPHF